MSRIPTMPAQGDPLQYLSQFSSYGEMRNDPEENVVFRSRPFDFGGQRNDLQRRTQSLEYGRERDSEIPSLRKISLPARHQNMAEDHSQYHRRLSENKPPELNRQSSKQARQKDALLSAVTRVDPSRLSTLLAGRSSLGNLWEDFNWSGLLYTAVRGRHGHGRRQEGNRRKVLRILLCAGASPDTVTEEGVTPLHVAAKEGKVACLKELLRWKANINAADIWGRTALLYASEVGSISCVKALLEAGAAVDLEDRGGWTPLLLASRFGHAEVVRWLLSAGADPNYKRKEDGKTPLHIASTNDVVEILLQAGADTTVPDLKGETPVERAIKDLPSAAHDIISASMLSWGRLHSSSLHVAFNFDIFENGKNGETDLLQLMVKEKQKILLKHPVCETFLHLKWLRIRQLFYINLVFFFIYMIYLTMSVCFKAHLKAIELDPDYNNSTFYHATLERATNSISALSIVLVFILVLREIVQMACMRMNYWYQVENIVELTLVVLSLIVLIPPGGILESWQKAAGVIAMLLGWYEVTLYVGRFPSVGIYIQLFYAVTKRMLHFLTVYSFMFFGFAISFYLLQPTELFASVTVSMLQTLSMMAGELDYSKLMEKSDDLYVLTDVLYVIFVVMMAVVTMNLLVGLAVLDIQALMREAGVERLASTVIQEAYIESFFLSRLFAILPKAFSSKIREKYFILPQIPSRRFVDGTFKDPPIVNDQRKALLRAKYNVFLLPNASRHQRRLNLGVTLSGEPVPSAYKVPPWILTNITRLMKEKEAISGTSRPPVLVQNPRMNVARASNFMEDYSYSETDDDEEEAENEEEEEEEEREKWTRNDNQGSFGEEYQYSQALRSLSDRMRTLESSLNLLLLVTAGRVDDVPISRTLLRQRGSRSRSHSRHQTQEPLHDHLEEEEEEGMPPTLLDLHPQERRLSQHQHQEPQLQTLEFQEGQVQQTTL